MLRRFDLARPPVIASVIALVVGGLSTATITRTARAGAAPPSPHSGLSQGGTHGPAPVTDDDTRFGEIGKPGPDPGELEKPPVTAGVAANRIGQVTYAGARVDVPLTAKWSVIPQTALLHISPYAAGDPTVFVPYVGAGVGHRPAPSWSMELSALYGPMAYGIESWTAIGGVSKELGGDWSKDIPPPVALELAASWNRFRWKDGNGPAGETITQWFGQAQALFRVTRRFHVIPRGMYFWYDKSLVTATGPRLGTVSVLSQVGTYAPQALAGGRIGYLFGERFFPFVDGHHIVYAADIGNGTQITGGLKVTLGRSSSVMAMGGVLLNRVGGALVSTAHDLSRVPVIGTELEVGF